MLNYFVIFFLSHSLFFLTLFSSNLPFETTTGKGIGHIYKYEHQKWTYPYPNTTFVIKPRFYTSIQTKCNSDSYCSAGANDLSSSVLDQSTNHHVNTDVNNNDDSQSYDTHWKNNCRYSSSDDIITTTTTPQLSTLPPTGK